MTFSLVRRCDLFDDSIDDGDNVRKDDHEESNNDHGYSQPADSLCRWVLVLCGGLLANSCRQVSLLKDQATLYVLENTGRQLLLQLIQVLLSLEVCL